MTDRLATAYLAVQALLTGAWWLSLATSATVRERFELDPADGAVLDAFLLPDLLVLVVGSVAGATAIARGSSWAPRVVAFTAGGCAYATLFLVLWVAGGGDGWVGIVPMALATVVTAAIAMR